MDIRLPHTLKAPCCYPGKSCGDTELYLSAKTDHLRGETVWAYLRESNDDVYVSAGSEDDLIQAIFRHEEYWVKNNYTTSTGHFVSTDPDSLLFRDDDTPSD